MGLYNRDYGRADQWGGGGDWRPEGTNAPWSVNTKLLVTMAVVYVIQILFHEPGKQSFVDYFELKEDWFYRPWECFQLVTYGFMHSTQSITHLVFNGIALFFFGRVVEARYGSREYLAIFLFGVIASGFAWSAIEIFTPNAIVVSGGVAREVVPVLVGASGGISTVLILFALNYPRQEVLIWGIVPVPAWLLAVLFIGQDIMGALTRSGNVAYTAHLAGALFGYLYFSNQWRLSNYLPNDLSALTDLFKTKPKLRVHREDDRQPRQSADEEKLDRILQKINQTGMDSLSRSEKAFLEKESKKRQKQI